jgi:hypothetical protein
MRSQKIHRALAHGMSRFEVCQLVAKGVRATHKTGSRFEDTINTTLDHLGVRETGRQTADDDASDPKSLKSAA